MPLELIRVSEGLLLPLFNGLDANGTGMAKFDKAIPDLT
jgi:hypothetical protein